MGSNIEKIAKTLLELKKESNYTYFNKGFFKNRPELEGYYIDLSNVFKNKVYLILNISKNNKIDNGVKKINNSIFITLDINNFGITLEDFINSLDKKASIIIDLLEQVVDLTKGSSEEKNNKSTTLPLGYYEDENGEIKVDRDKANLARKIFTTYANLRSMKQVVRIVGAQLPYAERTQFNIGSVSKVLHDERYKNIRPSIVPSASFNQAQEILKRNRAKQLIKGKVKLKKLY